MKSILIIRKSYEVFSVKYLFLSRFPRQKRRIFQSHAFQQVTITFIMKKQVCTHYSKMDANYKFPVIFSNTFFNRKTQLRSFRQEYLTIRKIFGVDNEGGRNLVR